MPYTTSTAVATLLGTTFSSATSPTDTQVASIILRQGQFVDSYTKHSWTTTKATASDYFDVFSEYRLSYSGIPDSNRVMGSFWLSKRPVSSVTLCQLNVAPLWASDSWTTLASGYGGDFLIYRDEGYIEFIRWLPRRPWPGRKNLRVQYTYGEDTIPSDIQYAIELLSAEQVLVMQQQGLLLSSVSIGNAHYDWGGDPNMKEVYHDRAMQILASRGITLQGLWR